ncbi:MAG TPA: hypothetical protein VFQ38_15565 [Longimicrobiales bacterium]|nr:hypothetical protein [Longimicrobiales bacterium]
MMALGGCASAVVRGGVGYDAGTLAVSGVETGVGGQGEVVGYSGAAGTGFGLGPALELAGYSTAGDADPIAFTTVEARYRRARSVGPAGAYWELGSGLGVAWSPGIQRAAVPIQGEVGVQTALGGALLAVGVRERFLGLVGTGSPPLDAFNSVQLVVGLGLGGRGSGKR